MAISKIILNGTEQMDVTDTTAEAADVASGKYFYGADGVKTQGTSSAVNVSDTTATASDVASGKIFYLADGTQATGSSSAIVPSGTLNITTNNTYDVTNYASAVVNVSGGVITGEVLWANWSMDTATYDRNGTPLATELSITIPTAGTYKVKSFLRNTYTSTWYSANARFYKNGVAVGSQHNIPAATSVLIEETITCSAGDTIVLYANSAYSTTYLTFYYGLFICPV